MKQLLITIAAVVLVGCGPPKAPDISIHEAAGTGNIEAVKQHIAAGTDVNGLADNEGVGRLKGVEEVTPLYLAAQEAQKEIAVLLIANGADVNAKNKYGDTPLHGAAFSGHKEVAALLIANGADVNAKEVDDQTPLDWAAHPHNPNADAEITELLRKHGGKTGEELSIHYAAEDGNIEVVKQHLVAGTDVNAKNRSEKTPLHNAAEYGHKEVAELLIAEGADVNAKMKNGTTSLDYAISRKHPEIADLLRKHGGKTKKELEAAGN